MLLTIKQVAERCQVSRQYVEQLITENNLKATKYGRQWIVTEKAVKNSKLKTKYNDPKAI